MAVDKIVLISLPVSDQERAKSFYQDILGFKVTADFIMGNAEAGERAGNRWVTLLPPGGGPSITLTTWFEDLRPGVMKLSLSTADVEKTYRELKAKGVIPNNEISDAPWGKWFSIDDPDGNNWLITQNPREA
ncbi:MAG: VOC family protein [Anaerolineales bacterium]|jgi:catechol 2,3-dioxygenase-like lactoylglutathione lyase family enzyme